MKKYLILLGLVCFVTTSCYKKLEIAPPNAITDDQVNELLRTATEAEVETILGAIADALPAHFKGGGYATFNNQYEYSYQGQNCVRNVAANDIVVGTSSPAGDTGNYYAGNAGMTANQSWAWWSRGYALVHAANKVFLNITEDLHAANPNAKMKEYLGRAYLVRAYGYLLLHESFSSEAKNLSVPIYTEYNLAQPVQARASYTALTDSITKWLNRAATLFNEAGLGYAQDDNGKLNEGVVNFLLARTALLAGDYATVISACDKIIPNYGLMDEAAYVTVDTRPAGFGYPVYDANLSGFKSLPLNPEAILAYSNGNKAYAYFDYWMNIAGTNYFTAIDTRLYNAMDDNDYRKDNFSVPALGVLYVAGPGSFIDGASLTTGGYANLKFASNIGVEGGALVAADPMSTTSTEARPGRADYVEFRLSEVYLMKAEAQALSNNEAGAKATMDILLGARAKSGATLTFDSYNYGGAATTTIDKIRYQWRIEMWGERGLDWYNSRRWGTGISRAGSGNHHNTGMSIPAANMTIQIPMQEISTNNLIVQN